MFPGKDDERKPKFALKRSKDQSKYPFKTNREKIAAFNLSVLNKIVILLG